MNYSDPSGHIAVCFQGGDHNAEIEADVEHSGFLSLCRDALGNAGYNEERHGQILYLRNGVNAINRAYEQIVEAKSINPDEPVIIAGYSWGGAAASSLADMLNHETSILGWDLDSRTPIPVDLLYLIDPEEDFRGRGGRLMNGILGRGSSANSRSAPDFVSGNVKTAINLFAEHANTFSIAELGGLPAYEWTWANGMNNVDGASSIFVNLRK